MKKYLVAVSLLGFSSLAFAEGGTASILAGYGAKDGYNLGFGARGGYTASNVYFGGVFNYFLGKSESSTSGSLTVDAGVKTMVFGGEIGYDVNASQGFDIRPYAGVGLASLSVTAAVGGMNVSASTSEFAFWPGVMGIFDMGSNFAGLDFNYKVVNNYNAPVFAGFFGFKL